MPIIAFITVAGFFTAVVLCAIWWYVPKLQMRGLNIEDAKDRASVEDNFRKTIGQVIGGAAVLVGAGAAYLQFNQQQQAAREQLQAANDLRISNQVAKGFEQLTGDKLVLRLAGIFGLEGVMNASSDYYRTVLEALCAFVRDGTSSMSVGERPPTDIQAALTVIGRRKGEEANLGAATSTFEVTIAAAIGERWADTEAAAGRGSVRLEGARIPGVDLGKAFQASRRPSP